jgi:hypothetical protein
MRVPLHQVECFLCLRQPPPPLPSVPGGRWMFVRGYGGLDAGDSLPVHRILGEGVLVWPCGRAGVPAVVYTHP